MRRIQSPIVHSKQTVYCLRFKQFPAPGGTRPYLCSGRSQTTQAHACSTFCNANLGELPTQEGATFLERPLQAAGIRCDKERQKQQTSDKHRVL